MELVINKLNLDVMKSGIQATVNCKKGDILTRAVVASFRMNGQTYKVPNGATAVFRAKKPDGTVIYNNATVQDGKVHFIFTSQYCAVAGKYTGEIQLIKSGKVLYTPKFCISVEDNIYSDSEIESTNEYTQLTESIEDAEAALELAQNLHLIEYVDNLDSPGDDKYLYVLEEKAPYFTLTDFPTTVSCGIIFESTDDTYPLLLFTGMVLKEESYSNPGVIEFGDWGDDPSATGEYTSMFGYDVANEKWVRLHDFDYYGQHELQLNDEIILTDEAQGTGHTPIITDYVIKSTPKYEIPTDTRVVYLYDNSAAVTTVFYRTTQTGSVTYNADDNVIDLDEIPELLVGDVATPYVYDEVLNKYISLTDASLTGRIETLETKMSAAEDKLDFSVLITLGSTPTINHTFAEIRQAITNYGLFPVRISYTENNVPKYATGYINVYIQLAYIIFKFDISTKEKIHTITVKLNNDNTLVVNDEYTAVQPLLTAGDNISIINNVISATGGGGETIPPIIFYSDPNAEVRCTLTFEELKTLYNNVGATLPIYIITKGTYNATKDSCFAMNQLNFYDNQFNIYFNLGSNTTSKYMRVEYSTNNLYFIPETRVIQKQLTQGTGINIASDGTISVSFEQAEGGGF